MSKSAYVVPYAEESIILALGMYWLPKGDRIASEYDPDPDMPKAASDPAYAGTTVAVLADLDAAWKRAGLTLRQKQALLLVYGVGYTTVEAGVHMGLSQQKVSERAERGITRILNYLNGTQEEEEQDDNEQDASDGLHEEQLPTVQRDETLAGHEGDRLQHDQP